MYTSNLLTYLPIAPPPTRRYRNETPLSADDLHDSGSSSKGFKNALEEFS